MNFKSIFVVALFMMALGAGVLAWYHSVVRPKPAACGYCLRRLHPNLSVVAEIDGKRTQACCARCAISEANQQQKPLKLISVSDYASGRAIVPEKAWYVEGSRVMACNNDAMHMNEMKETQDLTYDRCSPGTQAFAYKMDVDAFTARNGGTVLTFEQLMREAHFQ